MSDRGRRAGELQVVAMLSWAALQSPLCAIGTGGVSRRGGGQESGQRARCLIWRFALYCRERLDYVRREYGRLGDKAQAAAQES